LLITAGGENVAPIPVEEKIKEMLPCISNVVLIGDKRKYLSCFLTLKVVVDRDNNDMPTNDLTTEAAEWCKSVGSNATKVTDILSAPDACVLNAIQAGVDKANKNATSRASVVQKWTILPLDVSLPTGELGPTLKLKRFAFNKKYDHAIDRFYS
jgi:long-chain-fatty-acid--CoA ligase ACSBG